MHNKELRGAGALGSGQGRREAWPLGLQNSGPKRSCRRRRSINKYRRIILEGLGEEQRIVSSAFFQNLCSPGLFPCIGL